MPWAAQIAVRTHTAVISSLQKTLHKEQIGDPDMRLSHQHIIAAVCDAANAAGKAVTQASHPDLSSAWQHLSPQDRGAAAGQMTNLSVITALDTARRLFIEANTAPRPQPLDPVLQQAAEMALHVAAEYRNQIGPALDRFSP